ncbi:MAG: SRPBCC family protein [Chloroflexia bacterium]
MSSFTTETRIDAPVDKVWAALADIGAIHRWNPGVVQSHVTTDSASGIGAGRHCDLGGRNYLKEEVVEWSMGKRLTMRITDTNLPFKSADIRFRLQAGGSSTIVTVSPDYSLKFGLLGKMLDRLYVRGNYMKGMRALLSGLKRHVEDSTARAE